MRRALHRVLVARELEEQRRDEAKLEELGMQLVSQLKSYAVGSRKAHFISCDAVTRPLSVYGRRLFERNGVTFVHKDFSMIIGGPVSHRRVPLGPFDRVVALGQGCELHVMPAVRRSTRLDMMSVW